MKHSNRTLFWTVSLRGEVLARMTQQTEFGDDIDSVDLAMEEARVSDRTGIWAAIKDSAIMLPVEDTLAVEKLAIAQCQAIEASMWEVTWEGSVMVRTVVTVEADTAAEAAIAASMALPPELWRICTTEDRCGAQVLIGTPEVLECFYASNVTPTDLLIALH